MRRLDYVCESELAIGIKVMRMGVNVNDNDIESHKVGEEMITILRE